MNQIELNVKKRESGKKAAKKVRNEGLIPGVYYMKESESIAIYTDKMSLRPIVYTAKTNIIELHVDGDAESLECVLKDVVFNPITDEVSHFDLLGIKKGQKFTVDIPIVVTGTAIGLRDGGILQQSLHKITISCFPKDLVESFIVDVTELEIGDSIHIKDLDLENFDCSIPIESVIAHVVPPRVITDEEEGLEGEEGEEGEEGAEGEGEEEAEGGEE